MALEQGWLEMLIRDAVATHSPDVTSQSVLAAKQLPTGHARARRYLRGILRESGVLYGTPPGAPSESVGPEERLFMAVLRTFCRAALDIAMLADAAPGPRAEQLLVLLLAMIHRLDEAEDVQRRIERATKQWPLPKRVWRQAEEELEKRALSLAADPYYGLVLHNGAVYADANAFGRVAIAYFTGNRFPRGAVERRIIFADTQKALLVRVLIGLVCAERKPSFPTRRAILRQLDDLQLPDGLADATRDFARRAFDRPPAMKTTLKGVRSVDLKRFIVEQTVLASLVDGRRSPREQAWTKELGRQLGFSPEAMRAIELSMAEFYARHRDVVDVFTLAQGAEVMGEEMVDSMSTAVRKNYRALMREVKETGELSVLLARAARGQKLSADEKRQMRQQLIDVAKAIPALAIFTAPGGILLLIALAKVMPFDLLPSSFRDDTDERDSDRTEH